MKPLRFTVSNEDGSLAGDEIAAALSMAQEGLSRAGREMCGKVTMTFDPSKITFEYVPAETPT
jgi:hypothetical protein